MRLLTTEANFYTCSHLCDAGDAPRDGEDALVHARHNFGNACFDASVFAEISDILALLADYDARIARADESPQRQRVARRGGGRRRASCARGRVVGRL